METLQNLMLLSAMIVIYYIIWFAVTYLLEDGAKPVPLVKRFQDAKLIL